MTLPLAGLEAARREPGAAAHDERPAPASAPAALLEAEGLTYEAGGRSLLRGVSFDLPPGALTVLAGPNGAGKSTLLRLLAGDARPSAGRVALDGRPLAAWSPAELARRRAVMPQETALAFAFTVEEVVRMGRHPAGARAEGRHDEAVVLRSMEATETTALRGRTFPTLSGGEKARVTLARVLAQESPLLLLDEPTASLDPRHQHLVMRLARRAADTGGAALAVLHDLNLAALYADEILLLHRGAVHARGAPRAVLTPPVLEEVFETPFEVLQHPHRARPLVVSLPSGGN